MQPRIMITPSASGQLCGILDVILHRVHNCTANVGLLVLATVDAGQYVLLSS